MKKTQASLIGGFLATVALLLVVYIENMTGYFAFMSPIFVSAVTGSTMWLSWLLHLIAGWVFAFIYAYFFIKILSWVKTPWLRGTVYGLLLAVLIEISLYMTDRDIVTNNLLLSTLGLAIAYMMYGAILGMIVLPENKTEN
ncbi:DUF6789 family protein [Coprobacter tertius]|uniref:DUF2127 domain-containing protein n=1 Tax=Coprobacter tertius TaxID=2944915 RepID=A0ABT1MEH9_9BACT|nr:DUF6789 family protein [Coprobacter tertius]MCP9611035.1 hypothetical protein [Coprobacter tertius]